MQYKHTFWVRPFWRRRRMNTNTSHGIIIAMLPRFRENISEVLLLPCWATGAVCATYWTTLTCIWCAKKKKVAAVKLQNGPNPTQIAVPTAASYFHSFPLLPPLLSYCQVHCYSSFLAGWSNQLWCSHIMTYLPTADSFKLLFRMNEKHLFYLVPSKWNNPRKAEIPWLLICSVSNFSELISHLRSSGRWRTYLDDA